MQSKYDVVIVGAGQAGGQAAVALRVQKFTGTIALVGEEVELPYDRPSLSKEYLAGDKEFDRMLLRPATYWAEREIDTLLGRRVVAVDAAAHRVRFEEGAELEYGTLVWATGGKPRKLACSGHELRGVHAVRDRADVDRMRSELDTVTDVVIIGGGYIGLEAAAVLRKLGKNVTVLEAQDRVLARVAAEPLSRFFEAEHRAKGVIVRLGAQVVCLEENDGAVSGVRLHDGEVLPAHLVVVGIGIEPAVQPLLAAGAEGTNGVFVDLQGRTTLPDVFAIGDCALHANPHAHGEHVRLESIQNANDQATIAVKTILGGTETYDAVPWFWSNQYDLKLQTMGLSLGHDETVLRGSLEARSFALVYLREGRVIALDCVNSPRDYVQGKALITAGTQPDRAALASSEVTLKSLV